MTPERYRQIGELYHAALQVDAAERAAFIARACAGDTQLEREVASLIESHQQAPDFIATPALAVAAELMAQGQSDGLLGTYVGRYRVLSLIALGGMGRVYLAEDTDLGRRVALKFLPEYFTRDRTQVQRFRQEARAASALNHPGILTVYEIGQANGTDFIATEYVEGETLRTRLTRGACSTRETLNVAAQTADALAAAHRAGIVHRDVKPENVMLRPDGFVKVLDFGLAKLTENVSGITVQAEATTRMVKTNPGVVMGTAQYMSPEQARGLPVDARTDVWSLGVIIYEMIAGRRPFEEPTHGDTIVAILEREPPPLMRYAPDVSPELVRIVTKALAKNAETRYQTMNEMAVELARRRRLLDAEIERSAHIASATYQPTETQSLTETNVNARTRVSAAGEARPTSSVEYIISQIRQRKLGMVPVGVVLVVLLASMTYGVYRLVNTPKPPAIPFARVSMTRLTATGKVQDAAISPDGKHVAYVEEDDRQQSLWVRQVATGSSVQIISPADVAYFGLTFSPDGNYIYYATATTSGSAAPLYRVPSLGGASTKITEQVDSAVTFSPDGRRFAFIRALPQQGETSLIIVNADGTAEQTRVTRKHSDFFVYDGIIRPAWSPDGNTIACAAGSADEEGIYFNVVGIRVEDGTAKVLTAKRWGRVSQVEWLANNSDLVMVAKEEEVSNPQLWRLSVQSGEAHRITNDLNRYNDVSLSGNAMALVTVQSNRTSNIWIAPDADARRATQITTGTADSSLGLSWTPDGRIVFQSDASGKPEIWIMNSDGSDRRQLTHDGYNYRPAVSAAGRYIVFHSFRGGKTNVWRMELDGGNQRQLTNGKRNFFPDVTPDGEWVIYSSVDSGEIRLWKVSIDGGNPVQLDVTSGHLPIISPDGKQVAAIYQDEKANPPQGVMIFPIGGGQPTSRLNFVPDGINGFALHWSLDGRAILHFDEDLSNIWSQPVDGSAARQVTTFAGDPIFNFSWSHDGKLLALARGRVTNDVILITDLR